MSDSQKQAAADVVFVEGAEPPVRLPSAAMALAASQKAVAGEPVKVRVIDNYRVCYEGNAYVAPDEVTVPADKAHLWLKSKWVELVQVSQKRKES
jgi:hypothetical protein